MKNSVYGGNMRLRSKILVSLVSLFLLLSFSVAYQNAYANGTSSLVETQWVADNSGKAKLVYVGFVGDDDKAKYDKQHIAGSVYFGMNDLMAAMRGTGTPDKAKFEAVMGQLGISNDSHVVLYSTPAANPFIPGAYWLMKYFGHSNVSIINGSLDKWNSEGRPTTADATTVSGTTYSASAVNATIFTDAAYVLNNHKNPQVVVVDTRAEDEFTGQKEITYIKGKGHIPGAVNLNFYPTNRNADGTYKSAADLKTAYEAAGVTADKEVITYCEGGPRATDTLFALTELLGYKNVKVYIGSWLEWGNDEKYPVEK